jgi:hypothetical protein
MTQEADAMDRRRRTVVSLMAARDRRLAARALARLREVFPAKHPAVLLELMEEWAADKSRLHSMEAWQAFIRDERAKLVQATDGFMAALERAMRDART